MVSTADRDLCAAWKGETVAYADGDYPMRTDISRVARRDVHDAIRDLLPSAAAWLGGHDVAMPPGSIGGSEGLEKLAQMWAEGLAPDVRATLTTFALRLGARPTPSASLPPSTTPSAST